MNLMLLSLVPWALAFRVPSGGVKPKTAARLQAAPNSARALGRALELFLLKSLVIATTVMTWSLLTGFHFPGWGADGVLRLEVVALGLVFLPRKWFAFLQTPESRVRPVLRKRYDPPPSDAWTGAADWEAKINAFVEKNPLDKTLVLVDPSGTARRNLLDDIFRGQIHVIAPALGDMSFKRGLRLLWRLCDFLINFFGFKDL